MRWFADQRTDPIFDSLFNTLFVTGVNLNVPALSKQHIPMDHTRVIWLYNPQEFVLGG